ncbi:hypothetical protein ABT352_33235 [Streptosporangium sp. NPDC000563]|uniref:hypothetical protein n=1 Tax=Streptosporangium sp. NPDC000563 TaxID=3154366 RepID=UPI00331AE8A9
MTTNPTTTVPDEDQDERHDCRRDGCTYEVITTPQDGPTQIVCSGTCGQSWPVGPAAPAERVAGYLTVSAEHDRDRKVPWINPQLRPTPELADRDRTYWQPSHNTMRRGLTLRLAKVVYLDQPEQ